MKVKLISSVGSSRDLEEQINEALKENSDILDIKYHTVWIGENENNDGLIDYVMIIYK